MKKALFSAVLVAAVAATAACYPHRLDNVNTDVVVTLYDSTANFQATTYYLRPTVVHLVPPGETDNISRVLDPVVLATIQTNMDNAGYTASTDSLTADIKVMAAATTTDYSGWYYNYWCYGWYYYCPPYWGYYEYTLGSVLVSLKDRRVTSTASGTNAMWLGIGNGLLDTGANATRVTDAIDQMFRQSPYISAN